MNNKIHLNLTEEDRAKFEKFKKHNITCPKYVQHHNASIHLNKPMPKPIPKEEPAINQPEKVDNYVTEEEAFEITLIVLSEGMKKGNQIDKKSAENLVRSIKYKFGKDFANNCLTIYEQALIEHEKFLGNGLFSNVVKNTQNLANEIGKITQRIFIPNEEKPQQI
jgi:hypothetical protein